MLKNKLISDLLKLGLPTDFKLQLKGYSKAYNGRYDPNTHTIILYTLNEDGSQIDYETLIKTVIHEDIHHYQWVHDKKFKRLKGVMHDPQFKALESLYLDVALAKGVIRHVN